MKKAAVLPTTAVWEGASDQSWHDLLVRIRAGDQEALTLLYEQSNQLVFRFALRILRDRGAAEEVALDVYMRVWTRAGSFNGQHGSPRAWLMTITRNRAVDQIRLASWKRREYTPLEDAILHSDDSPEKMLCLLETGNRVRDALAELKPEQRELITSAYFGGLSHQDLADHFALPLGTVKTRVRNGMIRLRELLACVA
ncbi:MAG: RNA polymerase sigma factor [Blastocatellia bacterium]